MIAEKSNIEVAGAVMMVLATKKHFDFMIPSTIKLTKEKLLKMRLFIKNTFQLLRAQQKCYKVP